MDKPTTQGSAAAASVAPNQPANKTSAAAPSLNNEVEMGNIGGDAPGAENDIMQIARVGDVPAMEKLFESGEHDATYTDDEGITPLHVRRMPSAIFPAFLFIIQALMHMALTASSGQRSITNTGCASSLSTTAPRSTKREESL